MKQDTKRSFFRPTKLLIICYLVAIFLLFLYTFTQVDLGLTMTRASIATEIQRAFQHIGYFNRPLSTLLVVSIFLLLFFFYLVFISFARRGDLTTKTFWRTVFILTCILIFSYTAFSYDIFNYIFDAKIFTHYGSNPYLHKALDYPNDPMLSFMHWTHRTYPYGPFWLVVSVPLSFIGLNYFLPTFFLFKILAAASYIGSIWMIGKIMRVIAPKKELLAMVIFALNPLVLVESLVSGHNDIVMMFFALGSLYFLIKKKYLFAFSLLLLSIGIKYATGFLLPMYIMIYLFERKRVMIPWVTVALTMAVAMLFAVIAASLRVTPPAVQPWYLLFSLPFAALLANRYFSLIPTLILSSALLANYLPFLYTGNWDPPIPMTLLTINGVAFLLSLIIIVAIFFKRRARTVA